MVRGILGCAFPAGSAWMRRLLVAALPCACVPAAAHPPVSTSAVVRIDRAGKVDISVDHDVLAFALNDTSQNIPDGPMLDLLREPDGVLDQSLLEASQRFETLCILTADDARVPVIVDSYPGVGAVREQQHRRPEYPLPIKLDLHATAAIAPTARTIAIRLPEMLGTVVLTVDRPGAEPLALPLGPNERSPTFDIDLARPGHADSTDANTPEHAEAGAGAWSAFTRFAALGFDHIIPGGPDHALFVLGLFLLNPRVKPVLLQISVFTVAHTITLTLTSLNVIGLPSSVVEPAIAASIAFIGIENLVTRNVHPWRAGVAFLFGLVHGMGVATAFNEAGFPPGQLVSSLTAFTVGVEAGHLCVLGAAFILLGWTRAKPWYRGRVAIPLSLLISAIALFWLVDRLPKWW